MFAGGAQAFAGARKGENGMKGRWLRWLPLGAMGIFAGLAADSAILGRRLLRKAPEG